MTASRNNLKNQFSRRSFLKSISVAVSIAAIPQLIYSCKDKRSRKKMILSFYLDDTNPQIVKAESYKIFLDYCQDNGIKGEASIILAYGGKSMIREPDNNQRLFLDQAKEAYQKGIDTHMEIMTHNGLFNFNTNHVNENGIHEGLWLHEPAVTVEEYQNYFDNIIVEAGEWGIKFTGLTWPGCGCDACTKRYAELRESGPLHFNESVYTALLNLAKQNKFRGRVIPIFYESSETQFGIFRKAVDGKYGVYDLMPNAEDHFGIWENSDEYVDPDYYISGDGKSGIILRHLENKDPYCMWYMHWQGVNPENGKGWEAFKIVNNRIKKYLSDQVQWMRPSDIATAYHDSGDWSFIGNL
jgi:hypothetical protein